MEPAVRADTLGQVGSYRPRQVWPQPVCVGGDGGSTGGEEAILGVHAEYLGPEDAGYAGPASPAARLLPRRVPT